MSWSEGSELMDKLIESLVEHVPSADARKSIYREFISLFEDQDCDTLHECLEKDPPFDEAYQEVSFFVEDEEDEEEDWDDKDYEYDVDEEE